MGTPKWQTGPDYGTLPSPWSHLTQASHTGMPSGAGRPLCARHGNGHLGQPGIKKDRVRLVVQARGVGGWQFRVARRTQAWGQPDSLPLIDCVTLGKSLYLSNFSFYQLSYLQGILFRSNWKS